MSELQFKPRLRTTQPLEEKKSLMVDYNADIFPLQTLAHHSVNILNLIFHQMNTIVEQVDAILPENKDIDEYIKKKENKEKYSKLTENWGPYKALYSTLRLLFELWNNPDDMWTKFKESFYIGLIKETDTYGDTSVSMGAAVEHFKNKDPSDVMFLNCGTGGIKYQIYTKRKDININENEIIYARKDYKPANNEYALENITGPNQLNVNGDIEKDPKYIQNKFQMIYELSGFISGFFPKPKESVNPSIPNTNADIPIFAFVTGDKHRQTWEENPDKKESIDKNMVKYFGEFAKKLPFNNNDSFLMTQDKEGELELIGTRNMYLNLIKAGLLNKYEVISSIGIGKGSTQFALIDLKTDKITTLKEKVGMIAPLENLVKIKTLANKFINELKNTTYFSSISTPPVTNGTKYIIALKSGPTIRLEKDREFKNKFLEAVRSKPLHSENLIKLNKLAYSM